jgi:hypothetical protein
MIKNILRGIKQIVISRSPRTKSFFMLLQIASEALVVYFAVLYLILFLAFSGTPLLISGYEAWIASIMYFVIRLIWLWRNERGKFGGGDGYQTISL